MHLEDRDAKQLVRQRMWDLLECQRITEPGVHGNIPAFVGADKAADQLATHPAWRRATAIKANPDRAQLPVRVRALHAGKTVYMAVPNLASDRPFYLLDPAELTMAPEQAALHQVAATFAPTVAVADMPSIDLVVCGSVAVNTAGVRLGKGAGYADIEIALLIEAGLISPHTILATTVHQAQIIDGSLPETSHDFRLDVIAAPGQIIECPPSDRPTGVTQDKIGAIPALANHPSRPPRLSADAP